jgi:hypothetical protein
MPTTVKNGIPYPEAPRSDELAVGVPAPDSEQAKAGGERRPDGTFAPDSSTVQSNGGKAHKGTTRLTNRIATDIPVSDNLKRNAKYMRKATCGQLARDVGGGSCGIIASALVKLGSEDMALRTAVWTSPDITLAEKVALATKLGVSARGHLLAARDVAARDAEARPRAKVDVLAQVLGAKS